MSVKPVRPEDQAIPVTKEVVIGTIRPDQPGHHPSFLHAALSLIADDLGGGFDAVAASTYRFHDLGTPQAEVTVAITTTVPDSGDSEFSVKR